MILNGFIPLDFIIYFSSIYISLNIKNEKGEPKFSNKIICKQDDGQADQKAWWQST